MIAHGRKQISEMVYARKASEGGGAVRLQNMIRGAQVVFGGLVPTVDSPYSIAATYALHAAFPTQWPIIRDYGWQHPEIVPYVNAYAPEDPKIAYSLVEGIGVRGIQTNDGAYMTLPTRYNTHYTYELKVKNNTTGGWYFGGNAGSAGAGYGMSVNQWRNGNRYVTITSTGDGLYHSIVADKDGILVDETYSALPSQSSEEQSDNISLHWCTSGSGAAKIGCIARFTLRDKSGNILYDLVPFKHNDEMVYLDLNATGTGRQLYYPKNSGASGSFTESIESPA